ncbi:hypothetical protein BGP75_20890 [Motiliproteus sp. MSK22-1]|nr:hypothetical protein BGP75_20890 [Motiliproteus sp. MSK22-1]
MMLFSCSLFAESGGQKIDRLSLPAMTSSLAKQSLLLDITVTDNSFYAVGERGHILYSNDNGLSWQQSSVPVSVSLTAIDFVNSSNGWAVGHDGVILNTRDAGRSWQKQLDGFQVNQMVVKHYQQLLGKVEQRLQLIEERGEDGSELEERIESYEMALEDAVIAEEEGPTKPFFDLLFISEQQGWVIGSYGLIFETKDGGKHWIPQMEKLENPDGFHLNAIIQTRQGDIYIAGEAGVLFRSTDNGDNWQLLDSPYEGSFYAIAEVLPEGKLLVTGLRGRGYVSEDQGDNWTELDMATRSTLTAVAQLGDRDVVAVGSSGNLSFSNDGGRQFSSKIQPGRRSYSALAKTNTGGLILVGQGGVSLFNNQQLQEALK